MKHVVHAFERAGDVLDRAGAFLASRPVEHNLILTLLHDRHAAPEPGRYWTVEAGGDVVGVVFQSPLDYGATLTPMPAPAVLAAVDAIVDQGVALPGISGGAATAASFAGRWGERTKRGAQPTEGQRLYALGTLQNATAARGRLRRARAEERELLVTWFRGFQADTGEHGVDPVRFVAGELDAQRAWLWDGDGTPVSMASHTQAIEGTTRVRAVYTPPKLRRHGYAGACVGAMSAELVARGLRCILYTDLANPTSNSIYRKLGYEAVAELVRYRFRGEETRASATR
jgi:ribosomal protein S18 acetylase RimI-like enzyme